MAYNLGPGEEIYQRRVNLYSSPDVEEPMTGQKTGTANEDCARVIRENRWRTRSQDDPALFQVCLC